MTLYINSDYFNYFAMYPSIMYANTFLSVYLHYRTNPTYIAYSDYIQTRICIKIII